MPRARRRARAAIAIAIAALALETRGARGDDDARMNAVRCVDAMADATTTTRRDDDATRED